MIHVVLPPARRPSSCPFVQRTHGVLRVLDALDEAYVTHSQSEPWSWSEGDMVFYTFPPQIDYAPRVLGGELLEVECGVGYDVKPWGPLRVYESEAWRHYMFGKYNVPLDQRRNSWVIPWAFDPAEWPLGDGAGKYVSFLGHLMPDKGIKTVLELARQLPSITFKVASTDHVCGLGKDVPSNVEFVGPVLGAERATFLGNAAAHLCPTEFVEPLCGSAIEAMLCGTPVVASNFGGFVESIENGVNGYRGQSIEEMMYLLGEVLGFDREVVRDTTVRKFSIDSAIPKWALALRQMRLYTTSKKNIQNSRAFASSVPK